LHVFDGTSGELTVGPIVEAESRDFSPRGLFLAGVNLACATRVHLYVDIPDGCIEVFGVVVHRRPQTDLAGITRDGVGIRFTRISVLDEERLDRFLNDRRQADEAAIHGVVVRLRAQQMSRRFGSTP
jgi:hypothetical protein